MREAREPVVDILGHLVALGPAERRSQLGNTPREALLGRFLARDVGVSPDEALDRVLTRVLRGVPLLDPAVVPDEAPEDQVHVAPARDLAMEHAPTPGVDDPAPGEQHPRGEVVLLDVVPEACVVAAQLEKEVAPDRHAAADEDLRQPAPFAGAVGEEDLGADRADVARGGVELSEEPAVQGVRVVVEHDDPLAPGGMGARVAPRGALVRHTPDDADLDAVGQAFRDIRRDVRRVVDDDNLTPARGSQGRPIEAPDLVERSAQLVGAIARRDNKAHPHVWSIGPGRSPS